MLLPVHLSWPNRPRQCWGSGYPLPLPKPTFTMVLDPCTLKLCMSSRCPASSPSTQKRGRCPCTLNPKTSGGAAARHLIAQAPSPACLHHTALLTLQSVLSTDWCQLHLSSLRAGHRCRPSPACLQHTALLSFDSRQLHRSRSAGGPSTWAGREGTWSRRQALWPPTWAPPRCSQPPW